MKNVKNANKIIHIIMLCITIGNTDFANFECIISFENNSSIFPFVLYKTMLLRNI